MTRKKTEENMGMRLRAHRHGMSLRRQMIALCCAVTLIPFAVGQIVSGSRLVASVHAHATEQAEQTLVQLEATLDAVMTSYDDLLYRIYADRDISSLISDLSAHPGDALKVTDLQARLNSVTFSTPYVRAATVIFSSGARVFYDRLTVSTRDSSWLDGWDVEALYQSVVAARHTSYLPISFAVNRQYERVPIFHMAHPAFDYRRIDRSSAIVVLSVNEALLNDLVNGEEDESIVRVIVDGEGRILSCPAKAYLGTLWGDDAEAFARESGLMDTADMHVSHVRNEQTGFTIYQLQDLTGIDRQLYAQSFVMVLFVVLSAAALTGIIVLLSRHLTRSFTVVADAMNRAGQGDLHARVPLSPPLPQETAFVATRFNTMMDRICDLVNEVREISARRRDAEITAMEAQINPHFLYNTLDTINWLAIDHGAYDISNAIASLAHILRYGVDHAEQIVTVREEVEWIKRYLSLSQLRLKNSLDFRLHVDEAAYPLPIRKLLFQPFVENALIHGYAGLSRVHVLAIDITCTQDQLQILIRDNGKGMTSEQVHSLFTEATHEDKHHLGVYLALERMRLYYGDAAKVSVDSKVGVGTLIRIEIPIERKEDA